MAAYFENAKVYKRQKSGMSSPRGADHVTQVWCKMVKVTRAHNVYTVCGKKVTP